MDQTSPQMATTTEAAGTASVTAPAAQPPATFRELALRAAWWIVLDFHLRAPAIFLFFVLCLGVLFPSFADQAKQIVAYAGTYLGAAALSRKG
jgi:hypothetical protein